ncbi:MAG: hypothetical protein RL026_2011 [Pseudomonadota bacterium]
MATSGDAGPRLRTCDIQQCEGMCCYDGACLDPNEEAFLHELVARVPALKAHLPAEYVVEASWQGESLGRKTATRPHRYTTPDFPAHFTQTRCVFADAAGFCELEKLARRLGKHPWTFKPGVCWQFPLQEEEGQPVAPPSGSADDPYCVPGYPGYASCTQCGRNDPAGTPWREALRAEIEYLAKTGARSLLGTPGHTVKDLLGDGA